MRILPFAMVFFLAGLVDPLHAESEPADALVEQHRAIRDQAVVAIRLRGLHDLARSAVTDPDRFVRWVLVAAQPATLVQAGHWIGPVTDLEELLQRYAESAASRIDLTGVRVESPVGLLIHAGLGEDGDMEDFADRLALRVLEAYRRETTLGQVLYEAGEVARYQARYLSPAGSADYVRAVTGRWCDRAGIPLSIAAHSVVIGRYFTPASYRLSPGEGGEPPDLEVRFQNPEPARFLLRYQPERDRLNRAFTWDGDWERLERCPLQTADSSS